MPRCFWAARGLLPGFYARPPGKRDGRLTSERLQSLSLGVEATRREAANDNGSGAEHGVTVRGAIRW